LTPRCAACHSGREETPTSSRKAPFEAGVPPPPERPRDLVRTWALAIGGLALAKGLSYVEPSGLLKANLAGIAAFLFVALPDARLRARGESWTAYGVPFHGLADRRTWRAGLRGAALGLLVCALIFPIFAAVFFAYGEWILPRLPGALARVVAPYGGPLGFHLRLPPGAVVFALVQLLVVALPEELFYRGWMQAAWARTDPSRGVNVLGARLGAGFVWTQVLFAVGHLVVLQPWRLATFFPGLLFGWVRARTGSVIAPIVVHALSNLFVRTLELSFYR
jgi:membrane protease YdiL (CAAX protease family)